MELLCIYNEHFMAQCIVHVAYGKQTKNNNNNMKTICVFHLKFCLFEYGRFVFLLIRPALLFFLFGHNSVIPNSKQQVICNAEPTMVQYIFNFNLYQNENNLYEM